MSDGRVFTITYWGVTGTLCAPLKPPEVTEKLTLAIETLLERDLLRDLKPGPDARRTIRAMLEAELPFHVRSTYGGNTTCVEVQTPDALLIFDCGSGFRELGVSLEQRWRATGATDSRRSCHVMVTHAHMDHTFATPFFAPYYNPKNSFTIWGPKVALDSLSAVLNPDSALAKLYFPPTFSEMHALRDFCPVEPGADFYLGSTRVTTCALNHPGGSMAYRIENTGRAFVFATDHEQSESPDPILTSFAKGADLLYTEGQYTQAEYDGVVGVHGDPPIVRKGWGHSPIETCVRTCVAAGVKVVHLGHRDPRRSDSDSAQLEDAIRSLLEKELRNAGRPAGSCEALVPYEGLQICL